MVKKPHSLTPTVQMMVVRTYRINTWYASRFLVVNPKARI